MLNNNSRLKKRRTKKVEQDLFDACCSVKGLDLIFSRIENQGRELRTVERKNEKSWDFGKDEAVGKRGERG